MGGWLGCWEGTAAGAAALASDILTLPAEFVYSGGCIRSSHHGSPIHARYGAGVSVLGRAELYMARPHHGLSVVPTYKHILAGK